MSDICKLSDTKVEIINLSGQGLSQQEARKAAIWMAKAFARAPATPALTIFFGAEPYEDHVEMHERFWSSHLNRVAMSGILIGAKQSGNWCGFRAFFEPGKSRQPYVSNFRLDENDDWDRFLELAGEDKYMARVKEWAEKAGATDREFHMVPSECYTTSIIVVDPDHQRKGIGRSLDTYTRKIVMEANRPLYVRIHEHILPFYIAQGYRLVATPTYTLAASEPFKVHFLMYNEGR